MSNQPCRQFDDDQLVQIVDAALADAAVRGGANLHCHAGCSQCCVGPFAINALDRDRLQRGFASLIVEDPERGDRLLGRVENYLAQVKEAYPGDPVTGMLDRSEQGESLFETFENERVCPVLDPLTRTCDLYAFRPMTCRVFGPPVRTEEGYGVCELCFVDADPSELERGELHVATEDAEMRLLHELDNSERDWVGIVAYALQANCRR